jgi:pSer/pThr/pTyr-binding forkhead associated (FHA) protein
LGTPASIRDLGSTNGTFVDGSKVREASLLDGSRITLGTLTFTFRAG